MKKRKKPDFSNFFVNKEEEDAKREKDLMDQAALHTTAQELKDDWKNAESNGDDDAPEKRQLLHDFLQEHSEMGAKRYSKYLEQDGPDNFNPNALKGGGGAA